MSSSREELQEALCRYTTDTLSHINTLKEFCDQRPRWVLDRRKELKKMKDIETRANVKIKNIVNYMKNKISDRPRQELEEELVTVLEDTRGGLEKLHPFLDAVERLSVTSLSVFKEDNQVLKLPEGIDLQDVLVVVITTWMLCPLLVEFKRDDSEFFLPRLQNVEVLTYQLDKYIWTTKKICEMLQRSAVLQVPSLQPVVDLQGLSDADIERMLSLIDDRCDEVVDLAGDSQAGACYGQSQRRAGRDGDQRQPDEEDACSSFIKEFSDRKPRMMQFLTELEESAVQLERMNFGAKVSNVLGSSVGAVGGVLSIVGLALIPVTAGASLALTITGASLGVTSEVNNLVTTVTEVRVNRKWQGKAHEVFKSFMEDMESLQDCLKTTMDKASDLDVSVMVGEVTGNVRARGKSIDSLVNFASAPTVPTEDVASAGTALAEERKALLSFPKMASDRPGIGPDVAKAALDMSQFIRARAALWRSEVDTWEKMSNFLREGQPSFKKKQDTLKTDFYLLGDCCDTRRRSKSEVDFLSDEEMKERKLCVIQ